MKDHVFPNNNIRSIFLEMQNIKLAGNLFSDIPGIIFPK